MKKMFIALICAISTVSIMANEYESASFKCEVSGDQSDLSNITLTSFPKSQGFTIDVVSVKGSGKVIKVTQSDDSILKVKKVVRTGYIKNYYNLKFGKLSKSESKKLLGDLGAESIPKLPYGFKFNNVQVRQSDYVFTSDEDKVRSQVHFKPSKNDGLSYHINITCSNK